MNPTCTPIILQPPILSSFWGMYGDEELHNRTMRVLTGSENSIYDAVVSTLQALLDELLYILNRGFHLSSHGFRLHFGHLRPRGFESIPSSMFFTLLNLCKVRDPSRSARCCRLPSVCCLFWVWSCPRTKKMSLLGKNAWKITRYGNTLILSGASP